MAGETTEVRVAAGIQDDAAFPVPDTASVADASPAAEAAKAAEPAASIPVAKAVDAPGASGATEAAGAAEGAAGGKIFAGLKHIRERLDERKRVARDVERRAREEVRARNASREAAASAPKQKPRIIRSRGMLANENTPRRLMFFAILLMTSFVLTFTQLGFVSLDVNGDRVYVLVLVLPLVLTSLMLGTPYGTLQGFLAGIVLYAHAKIMPLDFYEMSFITPVTSVLMLTVMGFMLGVCFAFALRNNPGWVKRIIYVCIICFVLSTLYSIGFVVNVILTIAVNAVYTSTSDQAFALFDTQATRAASRMGDVEMQMNLDTLFMIGVCLLGFFISDTLNRWREGIHLRTKFNAWLGTVVLGAFMVTAAMNFVSITMGERNVAEVAMRGEIEYICELQNEQLGQVDDIEAAEDTAILDEDTADKTVEELAEEMGGAYILPVLDPSEIVRGYEEEVDGIVLVTQDRTILASNIPGLDMESGGYLNDDIADAIDACLESGELQRFVYDGNIATDMESGADISIYSSDTEPAYLFSGKSDVATVTIIRPSHMVYAERWSVMGAMTVTTLLLLLVIQLIITKLLNQLVLRRIDETNEVLGRITDGDLDARVDIRDTFEFAALSSDINTTVDSMKGLIAEAETRMATELSTAKSIQESALPRTFPPYPDILSFDIYAMMAPAREVGGDFYDFFLIGDGTGQNANKLGFVIADVSGKGVPAALFMMKASSQLRGYVSSGMELGEAVENANRQLCAGNDAGMFVTAWVGVLDYDTYHVDYVNAGHNPPLLWSFDDEAFERGERQGSWQWLKGRSGLPLGLFDGMPYQAYSEECRLGEQFLLYTDGVTEAMDIDGNLYGEERLEQLVRENSTLHPRQLVEAVRSDVARYATGAMQSDDITILSLEVGVPPELTATLVVPAFVDELPNVNRFIHTELDRRLCPVRAQNQLDIAVEELFVNVCRYAYPDSTDGNPGQVRVSYTYSAEPPSVRVDIADDGIPYDPLAKPDAVTPTDIMEVPIGGLGILMAKQSVDDMSYERVDNSNIVSIVKRW